ncbi:HAMP domain-containing histidine kinase [Clostridium sp. Sa3CVN1]|uniref:histidine kinase n=2 Tax=Clostridiaceae TaxID=31979 RepID=A0ABR8PYP6_9CLOT|nr:HAMP domain-containing histidine kinase [Clostridium cibarium]
MFLFIKVLAVIIANRGKVIIKGNFIGSIAYVLKYGFRYKQTRRMLVATIICSIIFFILYLYLLAIGGYENNILVTFFTLYPFKGSIMLMVLPMIGIMYSMKKTIEISRVNDSLKKINDGNLDYHIVEQGGSEVLELIKNITKIKSGYEIAVEETLRNEKLKTELISNVSHDLRTPLTSIINYVNILKSPDITEEERIDYIKILEQKSKKLKVLIDDLFEMSKINSGKIKLNKENIDIMSLIHQAVGEYSYLYEEKNIEFKVNSSVEEIDMDLDGKMMSRVIENIVINALKYSLENTRVYIDVMDGEDNVEIAFKNIANYDMNFDNNDIFERFSRGDSSRNSKVEGSGLGLAIAKSIVELHDGEINVIREGDMFKIYIVLPKSYENRMNTEK